MATFATSRLQEQLEPARGGEFDGDDDERDGFLAVMLPRFGITMFYTSLVFFVGNLQVLLDLDEDEKEDSYDKADYYYDDDDTIGSGDRSESLRSYAKRLRRVGYIALGIGCLLFGLGLYLRRESQVQRRRQQQRHEW